MIQLPILPPTSGFVSRADGLFEIDAQGTETRICTFIQHLGNAVRDDGKGAADVVEFLDRTGAKKEALLPHRESVTNARKVFETLADQNFNLPETREARDRLAAYLNKCRQSPTQTFLLARRMGWRNDCFVIGQDVVPADTAIRLVGPLSQSIEKFGQSGTLAEYQDKVLRRAKFSSRLMAGVALAALAPLVSIIGLENGGINIVGAAGLGKTTILRLAGSFWGGGKASYVATWEMTDNAPETLGLTHCDLPLLLDELALLEPDPLKAAGRLKAIVHKLSSGQGKTRSHRAQVEDPMPTDFHVIFASTYEQPLSKFMREGGSKLTGGELARFVDIPADVGRNLKIFEHLPKDRKTGKQTDADRYLQRLNRACKTYYGTAGRTYLCRLVNELRSDRAGLEAFLRKEMDVFETKVANDPQVDPRVRRRFCALYAAGQLALHLKILPPECDGFMEAISSCYRAAVASVPSWSTLSASQAIETLGQFLAANRKRLFRVDSQRPLTKDTFRHAVGLRPNKTGPGKCVWVKTATFRQIFPGNHKEAESLLAGQGVICRSSSGHMANQHRVPGLTKKPYFYTIDWTKLRTNRSS